MQYSDVLQSSSKMDPDVEKLYSCSQWCYRRCSPQLAVSKHVDFAVEESRNVKKAISHESNVRYGNRPRQLLDIFEPTNNDSGSPTFVYIHGGYWQMLDKDSSCYCVKPMIDAGIRVVIPDYDLAPDFPLQILIQEIRELTAYLYELSIARQWGPTWLGGHSAGAHLAASVLCSDLSERVAGFVLISGVYDLRPLLSTSINTVLKLTLEDATIASPIFQTGKMKAFRGSVLAAVGEFDSPAFHEQQQCFVRELKSGANKVIDTVVSEVDHFTVVERLNNDTHSLTKMIIKIILGREK